jgi:MYXO-CTERM domain-containing protein
MVGGKNSLIATFAVLAGLGCAADLQAAFPPLKILPQIGTAAEKQIDPIPKVVPPTPKVHHTPEPGTMALAVIGAGTLAAWQRRRAAQPKRN